MTWLVPKFAVNILASPASPPTKHARSLLLLSQRRANACIRHVVVLPIRGNARRTLRIPPTQLVHAGRRATGCTARRRALGHRCFGEELLPRQKRSPQRCRESTSPCAGAETAQLTTAAAQTPQPCGHRAAPGLGLRGIQAATNIGRRCPDWECAS
jgi:hypothetical protein